MKKSNLKILKNAFLITVIFSIFSCGKTEIQQPTYKLDKTYFDKSKQIAKDRENEERVYIEGWIAKHPNEKFTKTENGFWIKYDLENTNANAKVLDFVKYSAELSDLEGNTIYTFEEFGTKQVILTKVHEIRAIEKAIQLMGKNEEATLLVTSFNGFGLYGDENKIGKNQVLKIKLKLFEVKSL